MKILQVITSLRIGGAEKLIVDMVPLYQEKGHQVDVLLFDGADTSFKQQLQAKGVKIYELGVNKSVYSPSFIFKLIPFLKKYDIVHTHNTAPQLFTALGSVLCSVVLVTTEHNTSNRRRDWKWYAWVDRWMYNRYKHVICISDAAEKNLKEYLGQTQAKVSTIYNGVNVRSFREAFPLPELQSAAKGKFVVVMVAGFRYQKDQDTLIQAFRHLPKDQYELWLVGDGERRPILENLVKECGLQDSVRFLGIRSDIPSVLKSADVVVMSSHFEGLSLSSIEGMSVGKPFVASDVDGLHEITEGYGVLFPHEDAQALACIIERLHTDSAYYHQVADRCLVRAQQYDIRKVVDGYLDVYHSLTPHA